WRNTCLDLRHRRDFDKVAIVGAPTWERWCAKLANLLITGEIKTFTRDELSTAWTWVRG
ncbi:STAS/SEC14 domain-containing protein, partial [Pseudonocardia sp. MH-G8]|uniref:STAS/SEC14 domain-containing protein n=1 Tax=Pseudonocardia sp. MH-G8 TaxID=1854588 RepID=UPI000BD2D7DA